jgi:PBP1b-binding outer membrane lipoprotein LpoB
MKNVSIIGTLLVVTALILTGCNTYQFEYREVNTTRYSPSSGSSRSSSKAEASSPINSSSGSYGHYGSQEPVRKPPTFSN